MRLFIGTLMTIGYVNDIFPILVKVHVKFVKYV